MTYTTLPRTQTITLNLETTKVSEVASAIKSMAALGSSIECIEFRGWAKDKRGDTCFATYSPLIVQSYGHKWFHAVVDGAMDQLCPCLDSDGDRPSWTLRFTSTSRVRFDVR